MTANRIAEVLAEIGTLEELSGEKPYRGRAFTTAARSLEGSAADLPALARNGRLTELPGVGPAIARTIGELLETGRSTLHEELRAKTPPGLYQVLRIPGLGTRKARALHEELGIDSVEKLEQAALAGRIAALPGFGRKTQEKVLAGISFARSQSGRRRLPEGVALAERLCDGLRGHDAVCGAEVAGEVRRRLEVVGGITLVAASAEPDAVLRHFAAVQGNGAEISGAVLELLLPSDLPLRVVCVAPERFGAALVWETGSRSHLAALEEIASDSGIVFGSEGLRTGGELLDTPDEASVYAALGLPLVPAELREGAGEVAAAQQGALPGLVETEDLRGTFHCHTSRSDGRASLAEMATGARERGWSYLGVADHSEAAAYAGGLSREQLREQAAEVAAWNAAQGDDGVHVFHGVESDILADGALDYDDETLAALDYVVGSVHSGFRVGRDEMTRRMVRAVHNPRITILGHPTGRLLLTRDAYEVDAEAVLDTAAKAGVVVEINADPRRLDAGWENARYAAGRGALIAINPDAHSVAALDNVRWGVEMARKAGLEPRRVLNTWPREEVAEYLAERKSRREG